MSVLHSLGQPFPNPKTGLAKHGHWSHQCEPICFTSVRFSSATVPCWQPAWCLLCASLPKPPLHTEPYAKRGNLEPIRITDRILQTNVWLGAIDFIQNHLGLFLLTVLVDSPSISSRGVQAGKWAEAYTNRVVISSVVQLFSVCSLGPVASVAPGKLERNADSQGHTRLTESDILGVGPNTFGCTVYTPRDSDPHLSLRTADSLTGIVLSSLAHEHKLLTHILFVSSVYTWWKTKNTIQGQNSRLWNIDWISILRYDRQLIIPHLPSLFPFKHVLIKNVL